MLDERNTSTTPENGSVPSSAAASAAREWAPFRKSTGLRIAQYTKHLITCAPMAAVALEAIISKLVLAIVIINLF